MKRKKVGTITLAVGLIILGAVLFATNFTDLAVKEIYKYWPILLIGVGIEMFAYMIIYKQDENVKIRLDGLCIAFIVIAALLATNSDGFSFNPQMSFDMFNGNAFVDGIKYKGEIKETIIKDNVSKDFAINKLIVRNSFGDVKLQPYDQKYIKVEANVRVRYNNEQAAREYVKNAIKITEGAQTDVYTTEYNGVNKSDYARAAVDFIVYVPQDVYADIHNSFGDIDVQGITKDINVNNQHGEIAIKDIGGGAIISNSFGNIEIKSVGADIDVDNQHGDITASNINGKAKVETSFGEVEVSDISGELITKNSYGRISVKNVKGDAQIRSSFGDVEAAYIDGNTIINDNNGSIEALELKGNAEIKNSFGKISYKSSNTSNADIYAKTSFGDIDTSLPINVSKSINDKTAQGKTGEGKYNIQLITNNGEIEIR